MTFGKYLHELLLRKNINMSKLAEEADIKNRAEIYRLFKNKCSYKKLKELTDKILPFINLSAQEKSVLHELLKDCKIKDSMKNAWGILEKLYCNKKQNESYGFDKINDFLNDNKNGKIKLFIDAEADYNFSLFLENFLLNNSKRDISVIHAVNFNKSEEIIAGELFTMIKLLPYDEYRCFEIKKTEFDGIAGIAADKKYRLFMFTDGEYVESDISRKLYEYLNKKYSRCEKGKELKDTRDHVTDYAYTITNFTPVDTNNGFSFEGVFCFGDIPFDIMYRLLEDANFFGFSPDSPYITNIVNAARARYGNKTKSGTTRTYVLSEERISELFKTGRTADHVDVFRPLTKEELNTMVKTYTENNDRFKYRFFKSGYCNRCIECTLVEDFGIILWDASLGYGKKHFQTVVSHPKAMSVVKSFTEYFWERNTVSDEESKEKLNMLIKKYLN